MTKIPVAVVAVRVEDALRRNAPHIPGAKTVPCDKCGADVWLAPSSQAVPRDIVVCRQCYAQVATPEDVHVVAPGAVQEWQAAKRRRQHEAN